MDTKLDAKKARFLSNVAKALKQMSSTSTVKNTTMDKVILRDLIQLENRAASGSVSVSGDLDPSGKNGSGEEFIALKNPLTFTHRLD